MKTRVVRDHTMKKGVRKSITIPGLLADTVERRCRELSCANFTPYAVELVCFDLRMASKHEVTLALACDTQAAQDAVDRELVAHYRPGQKREGLLVQLVSGMQAAADSARYDARPVPLSAVPHRLTFPCDLWQYVDLRWRELGYESFSAYITGLIRYDLLVGGPHHSSTGDCRSRKQRALTQKTLTATRKGEKRKTLLDHLIERAQGRPVTEEESTQVKARIAEAVRDVFVGKVSNCGAERNSST
jgi:hypothetical protein